MDINYVLTAHGVLGSGSGKPPAIEEVTNLLAQSATNGKSINLTWTNPTLLEFILVEIYVSTSDLTGQNYKACQMNHTLAYSGIEQNYTHPATENNTYYFKVFAKYNTFGENLVSKGVSISSLAKDTEPPAPITNFKVDKEDNSSVSLSWTNPVDADYNKIKILTKQGSYPTSSIDGTLVYEGAGKGAMASGLVNDTMYYFRAFTYDSSGNEQSSTVGMQITGVPSDVKIYGVKIDTLNSNPESAVTYTDSALGMTPAHAGGDASGWDNVYPFNQIRPVLFKNGAVVDELDKNDFSKLKSGGAADITTGTAGYVMIEFPSIWWKFETFGTDLYVKYATKQVDSTWKAWGHTRGETVKPFAYIGAYLGSENAGKLSSLSGKTPTANRAIGDFRTIAQANGAGYDQMGYYQLLMLQVLYIIRYKNRDSQTAIGYGYTYGNESSISTGRTDRKSMYFGEKTGKQQMKFSGIEDFWGNCSYWIDGMIYSANREILIGTENFNNTAAGYTNYGIGGEANIGGFIGNVQGGTETGFITKSHNATSTTYYSDYGYLTRTVSSTLSSFGGHWSYSAQAGAFCLEMRYGNTDSIANISSRLMFV